MKKLKKRILICLCFANTAVSLNNEALAVGLTFSPSGSSMNMGDSTDLDVIVSGLGRGVRMSSFRNIAAFEFNVRYDPENLLYGKYLSEDEHIFYPEYPRSIRGKRQQQTDISDHSCLWELGRPRHSDAFALATVSIMGSGTENSRPSVFSIKLRGDSGNVLSVCMGEGYADTPDRSESVRMFLMGCGMLGLARLKKKPKKRVCMN